MRNATVIVSFLDMDSPDVAILPQLAVFFLKYDPQKWRAGAGDTMFVCEGDAGVSSLYLIDDGTSTISIRYNHRKKGDRRGVEFYSLGDVALINNVVDVGDDQYVPRGSLVDPALAWQVLNEYVESPHELPKRIAWIPSDQIEWPAAW